METRITISLFLLFLIYNLISCNPNNRKYNKTKIEFIDTFLNLKSCNDGDTILFYSKYKNTGNYPLKIEFSQGSCGCTQPIFNKNPLKINGYDSILVKFYSKGMRGNYRGTVVIGANTQPYLNQTFFNIQVK